LQSGRTIDAIDRCIAAAKCGQNVVYFCSNYNMTKYCFDLAMSGGRGGEPYRQGMRIRFGQGTLLFKSIEEDPIKLRGQKWASLLDHSVSLYRNRHRAELKHFLSTTEIK